MEHRNLKRPLALGLSMLALASCSESPTELDPPDSPAPEVTAAITSTVSNTWITEPDMPGTARGGLATAVVPRSGGQSTLYAIGGATASFGSLGRVQAYNVATRTWTYRAEMPMAAYDMNGAGVINGKIYVSGGVTRDKFFRQELFMYDPATNTWTRKRDLPSGTWGGVTEVINNQLYVVTCISQEDCYIDNRSLHLFRYDPATDQWTELASPPPQLRRPMSGVVGGKLYLTGTRPDGSGLLSAYDPATNQWSPRTPMPRARYEGSSAAVGAKIYVFGGRERQSDGTFKRVRTTKVYDPATDTWGTRAPMPDLRSGYSASRVFLNGQPRIQVVGGPRPG
ncbi:MAG TPA: kelch repeat-containing protein, partial [Gemmatimonadales bacterium]